MSIEFMGTVTTLEGTALIRLPAEASERLPSRGQVAVDATIGGHAFRTVVEPDGRRGHWLRLGDELQREAGVGPGDEVRVSLRVSPDWPEPDVPADLAAALASAPAGVLRCGRTSRRWHGGSGSAGCRRPGTHRHVRAGSR